MNITRADIYYPHHSEPWEDTKRKAEEHGYSYFAATQSRSGGTRPELSSLFFEAGVKGLKSAGALSEVPPNDLPKSLNEVFRSSGKGLCGDCRSTLDVNTAACNIALSAGFEFVDYDGSLRRTVKEALKRRHLAYINDLGLPEYNPNPYNPNKEENTVKNLPESKADVYYESHLDWKGCSQRGKDAGYRWASCGDGHWVVSTGDEKPRILYQAGGCRPVIYNDLPDTGTKTFYERVMEFVNDPGRSDRNTLYLKLAQEGFFSDATLDDEQGQKRVINKLLKSDSFCAEGKAKFREHMGDLLDLGKRVITISVTVPGDAPEYKGTAVQGDIARHLSSLGQNGTGNFYREAEVLLVSDETIK